MNRLKEKKHIFEEYIMAVIFLVMLVLGGANVFLRYVFNSSIPYVDDLMVPLFVWLTMFGAACTAYHKANMGLSLLVDTFPHKLRMVVDIFVCLISIALFFYLMINGTQMLISQYKYKQTTLVPWIPAWFWSLCFPIGSACFIFRTIQAMIRDIKNSKKKEEANG